MVIKTKNIIIGLEKKGFLKTMGDHIYLRFHDTLKRKSEIKTKISHGAKEYDDILLRLMAKQLKINKNQLKDLINCPLSQENYEKLIQGK